MKRIKEGKLIEILYEKYFDSLMVIACSYVHDKAEAEDLVHNVFVKAMLSYKTGGSFLYWANRVLRNEFYNALRARKRFTDEPFDSLKLQSQDDLLSDYIRNEEKVCLAAMISMLPLKYREVMMESVYLQMDNREIAALHGISQENVRQRKARAKKMLIKMRGKDDEKDGA